MLLVSGLMCSSLIGLFIESIATKRYSQKNGETAGGKLGRPRNTLRSRWNCVRGLYRGWFFELRRNRYGGRRCRKIGLPMSAIIFGEGDIIAGSIINGVPFEGIGACIKAEIGGCPANADGARWTVDNIAVVLGGIGISKVALPILQRRTSSL